MGGDTGGRFIRPPASLMRSAYRLGDTKLRGRCLKGVDMLMLCERLGSRVPPTRSSGIMITQVLPCPPCHGTDIVRHGQTRQGKQRYRCREPRCAGRTFLLDYSYRGQSPAVKEQIVDMAMHTSELVASFPECKRCSPSP